MTTGRKCRYVPLSKQPLVLVLCQVRFSPVRKMEDYIPAIQEEFRRHGFPIERAGKVQQMVVTPSGMQVVEQERWEYRTKDERWSITVLQDSLAIQTTGYERFEGFAERLSQATRTVLATTEQDRLGVVERVGLRYIDLVQPREGEDYRRYLRPGLHGVSDLVFRPGSHRLHMENVGRTSVGGDKGTLVVRVIQNDQGYDLPPDLAGGAPNHESLAKRGELVTLVDIDHYIEGKFEPDTDWIIARTYELHDQVVETFHEHVITEQAIEAWR